MNEPEAERGHVVSARTWVEQPTGRTYLVDDAGRIWDGLGCFKNWRYVKRRRVCVMCGGWTRAVDPGGEPRHLSSCRKLDDEGEPDRER